MTLQNKDIDIDGETNGLPMNKEPSLSTALKRV